MMDLEQETAIDTARLALLNVKDERGVAALDKLRRQYRTLRTRLQEVEGRLKEHQQLAWGQFLALGQYARLEEAARQVIGGAPHDGIPLGDALDTLADALTEYHKEGEADA